MGTEPEIDLSYLNEITGGDNAVMVEMLQLFLSETPSQIELLIQHCKSGDWSALKDEAHKVKPTFLYLGLEDLHSIVLEVETNAKNRESLDQTLKLAETLKSEFDDCILLIQNKIEELNS